VPRSPGGVGRFRRGETFPTGGHNTEVADVSTEVAERLRRRYPPSRMPRAAKVALVGAGVAVALTWLIWAALVHATPAVAADVSAYRVQSDTVINVTMTVDRRDPALAVTCRVVAQSADYQIVGEQQVPVEATPQKVVNVTVDLTTLRRATSASVKGCTLG